MATEKLVDGDFLAKLVSGSMETAVGAVDEAVMANAGLFGGEPDSVSTIATYEDHMIVANEDGDFYRAKWDLSEDGVTISDVEEIDVPVYEAGSMGSQVREEAAQAAAALLADDMETADEKLRSLYQLVKSGVRLTAEGVEDLYQKQFFTEGDWFRAVQEQDQQIRTFLGTEALRVTATKSRFANVADESVTENQAEAQRGTIAGALAQLSGDLAGMRNRIALAKQVTEGHQARGGDADDNMTSTDFVEFVAGYGDGLDNLIGILGDAQAVSEDGCLKCLARLHDGIAEQMYEWGLAAAFCEKLARRFVVA